MRTGYELLVLLVFAGVIVEAIACVGESNIIHAPGKKRAVRQSHLSEFVQAYDPKFQTVVYSELAFYHHLTDEVARPVLRLYFTGGDLGVVSVTPNHYILNREGKLMRADEFNVGDELWVMTTNKSGLKVIRDIKSGCERVTNVHTMNDYIVVNNVVMSCFSSVKWLDVDIIEVKEVMWLPKSLYRLGLGVLNYRLDELFLRFGGSVCGPPCNAKI